MIATVALYGAVMFILLNTQAQAAFAEFGALMVFGYISINLALLVTRYLLIRRTRARVLKLPAPKVME